MSNQAPIRIQKLLADQNIASRRKVEVMISEGRITINRKVAQLGDKATLADKIAIDGKLVRLVEKDASRVILYHKPEGEICSNYEAFHESTVFDNLPKLRTGRWISVGRLDINTSGLLIFTNDGDLAHKLMHPKHEWERIYVARVRGKLTDSQRAMLLKGVMLEGSLAKCSQLSLMRSNGANSWYQVGLFEGKNREVKKLFAKFDMTVSRLKRIKFGPYSLPMNLRQKQYLELKEAEIKKI